MAAAVLVIGLVPKLEKQFILLQVANQILKANLATRILGVLFVVYGVDSVVTGRMSVKGYYRDGPSAQSFGVLFFLIGMFLILYHSKRTR